MHILYCHDASPDAWLLKALREAGHGVTLVRGMAGIEARLITDPADVIIADRAEHPADLAALLARLAPQAVRVFLFAGQTPADPPPEADICLGRPLLLAELMVHLRTVARGRGGQDGVVELLPERRAVRLGAQVLQLGAREYQLLDCLMQQPGATVSPGQLCQRLWNDPGMVHADALKLLVHRLRARLRRAGGAALVETVRGAGYRFSAGAALS